MEVIQRIKESWDNISIVQKALLIAILMTAVIAGSFATRWASKPEMKVLYTELDPEEAGKITDKISEKNIPYELKNGGSTIFVPKQYVSQLRLDLAKDGLPQGGQKGYGIFEDQKIGISPLVQNVNLKRALEDELAKSIQMIEGVIHARVHIVDSRKTLFTSKENQTTASVVLQLKAGYRLVSTNIAAITHLVSGGVEGLTSENVTIIDNQGRLLSSRLDESASSGAATVQDYRERVEHNLSSKAEDMLTAVLGPGRATVRVSAIIDMTRKDFQREIYDESKKVVKKEEIKETKDTSPPIIKGDGEGAIPGGAKTDNQILTEYAVPKTIEQTVEMPGEILSLSVAAVVDLSVPDANESTLNAKIMEVDDVRNLIVNALGLNISKNDTLSVVEAKFNRPDDILPEIEEEHGLDIVGLAGQASMGIVAICGLLVLKIFSGGSSKSTKKIPSTKIEAQLPEGTGSVNSNSGSEPHNPASMIENENEPLTLRKHLTSAYKESPDEVKALFSSWVSEKGN